MQKNLPKKVHVIGICGVATSALAIAFHKAGSIVTGSDKGFFPPVSTELQAQGVSYYAGWHPEKMTEGGLPDVCIVGTASGSQNPETLFAKEKNIPIYSFAEAIGTFFAQENSIVCVGTWGKTSSSALLSHIFIEAGLDPTYMFGGVSLSHESAAHHGASKWSIFEGDEYKSSPTDTTAKFFYYKATHLLLTAVSWDHADLYPTEKDYFDTFRKLIDSMPANGFTVANKNQAGVQELFKDATKKPVWYGKYDLSNTSNYAFKDIEQNKNGLKFKIVTKGKEVEIKSPMLGSFQAENITGCFAIASELGIPLEKISVAIASFKGMKRRLEKRIDGAGTEKGVTVFDDIAHSPEKASSVLRELRTIYSGKITAVFEPNSGGRQRESIIKYNEAFINADLVIIPRLTKLKISEEAEKPLEGNELAEYISKTHTNVLYIENDEVLSEKIVTETKSGDVIVFLGSHGFRGMIEETISKLR